MEITLSSKGDYAVRAVLDLARHYHRQLRSAREIADEMRIPKNFLSLILPELVRAGLLDGTVGRAGGYELARPPRSVSLLEVVEIVDGPIAITQCLLRNIPCGSGGYCAAHDTWMSAQEALKKRLAATSFAALAKADNRLRGTAAAAGRGAPTRSH